MKIIKITAVPLIVTALSSNAYADWNYIKWGMTKKDAIAASQREARPTNAGDDVVCAFDGQKPFAVIPKKSIGGFEFQVVFCTDGKDRVTSVAMSPVSGTNLPTLKRALISQYGSPTQVRNMSIWNDRKSGNTVTFWTIDDIVGRIEYKRLGTAGL